MKKVYFIVIIALCSAIIPAYAQGGTGFIDGIPIQIVDGKYYQGGQLLSLDSLQVNLQMRYPDLASLVSESKSKRTGAAITDGIGYLFMIGALSTMITGIALESPEASVYLYTAGAINSGCALLSFIIAAPLRRSGIRSMDAAVDAYNLKIGTH